MQKYFCYEKKKTELPEAPDLTSNSNFLLSCTVISLLILASAWESYLATSPYRFLWGITDSCSETWVVTNGAVTKLFLVLKWQTYCERLCY